MSTVEPDSPFCVTGNVRAHTHTYTHTDTHTRTHTNIHARAHTHTHNHTCHICIFTNIHTLSLMLRE